MEQFGDLNIELGDLLDDIVLTEDEIIGVLKGCDPNKAMGPDNVHPKILKEAAESLATPLYLIFKESLRTSKVPSLWTRANVTPIFKKGSRTDPSNYRPVSLTSQVCKLFEKIIRDRMTEFLMENRLFSNCQHGFRVGRSCLTNQLDALEDWTSYVDNHEPFDVVFLDFRKAFDSVPHERLLHKLHQYGIRGKLLGWIEAFLTGRQQRVVVNGVRSEWVEVVSGVPQGSVLGPILFILYVNDLPQSIGSVCSIFADDTKVYRTVGGEVDRRGLQDDLDKLGSWSDEWMIHFNEEKCKVLHCGVNNGKYEYKINGKGLKDTGKEKDLGITISQNLKWETHITSVVGRAFGMLNVIRRTFEYLDEENFKNLYKTFIRPHLEYNVQVWSPYLQKDIMTLERVQRVATKCVPSLKNLSYEERLEKLGLYTLAYRRQRGDAIVAFKLLNGLLDVDEGKYFQLSETQLRGHSKKLFQKRSSTNIRKNFFTNRVVASWNRLPPRVVESSSVEQFKHRYDHCRV